MNPKFRWLLLLVPLALFAWAYQAASWRPKVVLTFPAPGAYQLGADRSPILISPDGRALIYDLISSPMNQGTTLTFTRMLTVYDIEGRGTSSQQISYVDRGVVRPVFSPDGGILAVPVERESKWDNEEIQLIFLKADDPNEGEVGNFSLPDRGWSAGQANIQGLAFSGPHELTITTRQGVVVMDIKTGKLIRSWNFQEVKTPVSKTSFFCSGISNDASTILTLTDRPKDAVVQVYEAKTGVMRRSWTIQGDYSGTLSLSPDGSIALIYERSDEQNFFYDTRTGQKLWGPLSWEYMRRSWSADSRRLITSSDNDTKIFDARTGREIRTMFDRSIQGAVETPDGKALYSLDLVGKLRRQRLR